MIELDKISGNVIEKLQAAGADKAYCTAATSVTREFNVDGGAFSLMRTLFENCGREKRFCGHQPV